MAIDNTKPFPFPPGYWQDHRHTLGAVSMKDYVKIFERHRRKRPGGKFVDADVEELMRLAEDLDKVHRFEIHYVRELLSRHPDYFRDEDQKHRFRRFADTHEAFNRERKNDFVEDVLRVAPIEFFREPEGMELIAAAKNLAEAIQDNEAYHARHGTFDPPLVQRVNLLSVEVAQLVDGFSLSDVDEPGRQARRAFWRNFHNFVKRLGGETDHEAKYIRREKRWVNWNRDITVYPEHYGEPSDLDETIELVKREGPLRMVAGGHAFNISSSMGGREGQPAGTLVTLDRYRLSGGVAWSKVDETEAKDTYHLSADQAKRVVRVSAGIRLRDLSEALWENGMAFPVQGSTDAQSIGGLIASDLHSTGVRSGFLSQQLLEVHVLDGKGNPVSFVKDDDPTASQPWTWTPPDTGQPEQLTRLPVSGALGTAGVVVEAVLKLDRAFNFRRTFRYVPREWAERHIEELLDPNVDTPPFDNDHVSFYYPGGLGNDLLTVRMHTWTRTDEEVSDHADKLLLKSEIFDHIGHPLLPDYLATRKAPEPGQKPGPGDDSLWVHLNQQEPLVLQANDAFARKLYFQHDELESGIQLPVGAGGSIDYDRFRQAMAATQDLLHREEFKTIIEVRFTPDASQAMLGPGTGGPTCYIELASSFGQYSKERIVEVFFLLEEMLRRDFRARPHLGKKTTTTYQDMADLYDTPNDRVWSDFQAIRSRMDPDDKFLPRDNRLLTRIFKP